MAAQIFLYPWRIRELQLLMAQNLLVATVLPNYRAQAMMGS